MGEGNKVTPFLEMENIYHHAVRDFKYMKAIFVALSLPKPKSDFLDVAEFRPYKNETF
jgi:hypothetical protein